MLKKLKIALLAILPLLLSACSAQLNADGTRNDPIEGFNRAMWKVNYDYLDPYVVTPVATGWRDYVPSPVKIGLVNLANNLDEPASFVNRLLEGEGKKAMVHFTRFWFNTVFGLGGLIDFASLTPDLKLENGNRDFGDTLGAYNVPTGAYVMLPAYGPTTPRQAVGDIVDTTYPVLSLLATPWAITKWAVQGVDSRAKFLGREEILKQSQDPYATFREAYFQNLEFRVKDGQGANEIKESLSEEDLKGID